MIEFNLIPYSARTCGKLQELDTTHRIQYVGNLDPIISQRGSYPTRPYHVSVYKIKDPVLEQVGEPLPCADPEGGQGDPPPPLKNHKNLGFLTILFWIP